MKVLLLRPYSKVFQKFYFCKRPPLNLTYLSSFLKQNNHEVNILDLGLKKDDMLLQTILKKFEPHLIGITACTPNVLDAMELIRLIKSLNNKHITVLGGPHSTSLPEDTLISCPEIDFIVIGEGELTFLELCNRLEKKKDIEATAGLCYRKNGNIIRTPNRPLIENLDDLPFPDRESILNYYHQSKLFDHNINLPLSRIMEVITTRGCSDNCTFCTVHRAYLEKGHRLRLRSAENVLNEIAVFKEKHKIKHVNFLDDSFTVNRERTLKIIQGLKGMRLSWDCETRVNLLDRDLVFKMVDSGCKKIIIGVESGSERILRLIKKNITLQQIRQAFRWFGEAKLETVEADFLVGSHPQETLQDIKQTKKLIKDLKPQRIIVSIAVPFPGTEVREQMLEQDLIFSNDWRKYILMDDNPPPWRTRHFTGEELKRLQNMIIAEFYFNFRNIITNLKYICSLSLFKTYFLSAIYIILEYFIYKIKPRRLRKYIHSQQG